MDDKPQVPQPQNKAIRPGPEIVASFLDQIATESDLDKATVGAILSLSASGKLTTNNLQKALESVRAGAQK